MTNVPNFCRKALPGLACFALGLLLVVFGSMNAKQARAQSAAATTKSAAAPATTKSDQGIVGDWQGTLDAPQKDLRTVVKVTEANPGGLKVVLYSIDQSGRPIPATSASFQSGVLKYAIQFFGVSYEGKMSADGKSIAGTWKQGPNSSPLVLERATLETAWTIPAPPPRIPPMAANANPSFEVATIKPSKPDEKRNAILLQGRQFSTFNTTLLSLIEFADDVQAKQVVGGPNWMASDKFDIAAEPDTPGEPNSEQLKTMVQKLLTDRFQLRFHQEKKEMSAYVLAVAKNGPKLAKSQGDPKGLPGLFFHGLGQLYVENATMEDFTHLMQSVVLDRPVVDQTGLQGRWNFVLKWTPDESQFGGMGAKAPPPSDAADAPPPLFTAIQEQIGLKLKAGKAPVEVLVLDHVEQPSPN